MGLAYLGSTGPAYLKGSGLLMAPFLLPIEFARQSSDGRLTLVLVAGRAPVPSLWARMSLPDLEEARQALARRERIGRDRVDRDIGVWNGSELVDPTARRIATWARAAGVGAVVWTDLAPKFENTPGRVPTEQEAVAYLEALPPGTARARRALHPHGTTTDRYRVPTSL